MALLLNVAAGERLNIDNGRIIVQVIEKTGRRTRLKIEADKSIPVQLEKPKWDSQRA